MATKRVEITVLWGKYGLWQLAQNGRPLAWGRVASGDPRAILRQMEWQAQGHEPPRPWPGLDRGIEVTLKVRYGTLQRLVGRGGNV